MDLEGQGRIRRVVEQSGADDVVAVLGANSAAAVEINAGMVEVDAGMSRFRGVVQCDTLIANSVVASSYTPGVGNVQ